MKSSITVGRSSSCDIIIPHDGVSRVHARISVAGGQYIYENLGKNGTVIGGRYIGNERVPVAAGTEILMAGRVPLPWAQVYQMLPLGGVRPYEADTNAGGMYGAAGGGYTPASQQSIEIWWGILAFLFPIVGWILYFAWKNQYPKKASQANIIAWVAVGVYLLIGLINAANRPTVYYFWY